MLIAKLKEFTSRHNSKTFWILFWIILFGLALRLVNLADQPYWGDEALSLDITKYLPHVSDLIRYLALVEVHPPLYYLILHFWIGFFGIGVFAVKFLSLIFGLACIIAAFFWGKIIFKSQKIGVIAALITAVLPVYLEFSQEARPYIFFSFFGALAAIWLWQYCQTRRRIFLAGYVLANLLGLYLHYSYFFIFVALSGWALIDIFFQKENRLRQFLTWMGAHTIILLGFSFWATPFFYKIILGNAPLFGLLRTVNNSRLDSVLNSVLSQVIWLNSESTVPSLQIFVSFVAQLLLIAVFIWALVQAYHKKNIDYWRPLLFNLWLIFIPLILFLFSPQSINYTIFFQRHIIFILFPISILISWAVNLLSKKNMVVVLIVFFLSLAPFDSDILSNGGSWDDTYDGQIAGDLINSNYLPGDIVLVSVAPVRTYLTHFLGNEIPVYSFAPLDYYSNEYDVYASRHVMGLIENEFQSRLQLTSDFQTFEKLDELNKLYHPKRIWLYAFNAQQNALHFWFMNHSWRQGFRSYPNPFEIAMYAAK